MKRTILLLATALSALTFSAHGTIIPITFDGPPLLPPETQFFTNEYSEDGMVFKPLGVPGTSDFIRNSGDLADFPDNGSAYLQTHGVYSLEFFSANGGEFDLTSIDLAEYSTSFGFAKSVTFVGIRKHGQPIETTVLLDGVIDGTGPLADFETFKFDRHWKQLLRVQIKPDFYSLSVDNVAVQRRGR